MSRNAGDSVCSSFPVQGLEVVLAERGVTCGHDKMPLGDGPWLEPPQSGHLCVSEASAKTPRK